jgi:hypothetical protein
MKRLRDETVPVVWLPLEVWTRVISFCEITPTHLVISKQWSQLVESSHNEWIRHYLTVDIKTLPRFFIVTPDGIFTFQYFIKQWVTKSPSTDLKLYWSCLKLEQLRKASYNRAVEGPLRMRDVFMLLMPAYVLLQLSQYKSLLCRRSGKRIIGTTLASTAVP